MIVGGVVLSWLVEVLVEELDLVVGLRGCNVRRMLVRHLLYKEVMDNAVEGCDRLIVG